MTRAKLATDNSDLLLDHNFFMEGITVTHKRKIYDIVALLGDLGGVTEVIMIVLGCLLYPIAESSYNMMSTKRLFLARTSDQNIFKDNAKDDRHKKYMLN